MNLYIKGHCTKGQDVIEILEMFGGININRYQGLNTKAVYYLDNELNIVFKECNVSNSFTLEEFKEKFPFKIGDYVTTYDEDETCILNVKWNNVANEVIYSTPCGNFIKESLKYTNENLNNKTSMEWIHKNIKITISEDGYFYFNHKGNGDCANTLNDAKRKIDKITKDYYTFSKDDIKKMLGKLNEREKDFVNSLMKELSVHAFNAYCEIGISEDMLFNWE